MVREVGPRPNLESIIVQLEWRDPALAVVDLSFTNFHDTTRQHTPPLRDPRTFVRVCRGLRAHGSVTHLILAGTDLRRNAKLLASAVEASKTLRVLDAHACSLGEGAAELAAVLPRSSLQDLELRSNALGPQGSFPFKEALILPCSLRRLSLGVNGLSAEDAEAMAMMVSRNNSLTELLLDGNPLGPGGAVPIAEALWKAQTVQELDLSDCDLSATDAEAFATMLCSNRALTSLSLAGNPLGDEGAEWLGESLHDARALVQLDLTDCSFGTVGVAALRSGIEHNEVLQRCKLERNGSHAERAAVKSAIQLNQAVLDAQQLKVEPGLRAVVQTAVDRKVSHGPVYWRSVSWTSLQSGKGLHDHGPPARHVRRREVAPLAKEIDETALQKARFNSHIKDLESRIRSESMDF